MTLKEIAQEAGRFHFHVSRVVNKNSPGAASKEVQDKIWEIRPPHWLYAQLHRPGR